MHMVCSDEFTRDELVYFHQNLIKTTEILVTIMLDKNSSVYSREVSSRRGNYELKNIGASKIRSKAGRGRITLLELFRGEAAVWYGTSPKWIICKKDITTQQRGGEHSHHANLKATCGGGYYLNSTVVQALQPLSPDKRKTLETSYLQACA